MLTSSKETWLTFGYRMLQTAITTSKISSVYPKIQNHIAYLFHSIDLPLAPGTAAGPSPFPERIALQLDADGLLTTDEYDPLNPSFDPPPGLWFLRPRPPEVTTSLSRTPSATPSAGF